MAILRFLPGAFFQNPGGGKGPGLRITDLEFLDDGRDGRGEDHAGRL